MCYRQGCSPRVDGLTRNVEGVVPEVAERSSHGWLLAPVNPSDPTPEFVTLTAAGVR